MGIALGTGACQGELKLLNKPPTGNTPDLAMVDEGGQPPLTEVSFRSVNASMDQPTLGCTGPARACHAAPMPATAMMKLRAMATNDMAALMENFQEVTKQINTMNAKESLFLTKPLATRPDVTHTGGKNYFADEQDPIYKLWFNWIRCGAKFDPVMLDTCPAGGM